MSSNVSRATATGTPCDSDARSLLRVAVLTIRHQRGIMDVWPVAVWDEDGREVTEGDGVGWTVTLDEDRSASLLVRVWLEGGTDEFRARLTSADTSPGADATEVTVG